MEQVKKKREGARDEIKRMRHCKKWRFMVLNEQFPSPTWFHTNSLTHRLFKVQVRSKIQGGDMRRKVEGFWGDLLHLLRLQARARKA